jgi:hypothetical protein
MSNVKAAAEQGDYGQHRAQRIGEKASAEIAAAWRTGQVLAPPPTYASELNLSFARSASR